MIWKILIVISLLLSSWASWAAWQNTKAIASVMASIDALEQMIRNK